MNLTLATANLLRTQDIVFALIEYIQPPRRHVHVIVTYAHARAMMFDQKAEE